MRADIFSKLQTARRSKTPVTLVDGLDGKTQALVYAPTRWTATCRTPS